MIATFTLRGFLFGLLLGIIPGALLAWWVKSGDWKDPYD